MSDKNWKSYVREDNPDLSGFTNPPDPQDYSDTLKFSDCTNVLVKDKGVDGGRENCIDAVRGRKYEIRGCKLDCNGTAAVVFKGSIEGWSVVDSIIYPFGKTDIEVGQFDNYWYPGRLPTRNGMVIGTALFTKNPVRVRCWDADKPQTDQGVVVNKVPWIVWFPYFCFRYLQVRITGQVPWVWKYDPPETPTKNGIPQ